MKIHRLELEFVGPFTDRHVIDFNNFVDSKVFLIEGPTGSGKSTLLDALVFGLYGSPATDRASTDRMRSDFAQSSDDSRVRVVFETRSGIYRITRTPKYERLATRGASRLTTKQPTVLLERLDTPDALVGETLSSKVREADSEVVRIIGLDRNQFRQTIILPQGEFARFLTAKSLERKAILQSIFKTQVFERTADKLREQANKAESQERRLLADLQNQLSSFAAVGQVPDFDVENAGPDLDKEIRKYLKVTRKKLHKRVAKAAKKLHKSEEKLSAASAQHNDLVQAQANFDSRLALNSQKAALTEEAPRVSQAQAQIKQISAALTLRPQLRERDEARTASQIAQNHIEEVQASMLAAEAELSGSDAKLLSQAQGALTELDAPKFTEAARALARQIAELNPAVTAEATLTATIAEREALAIQQQAKAVGVAQLTHEIDRELRDLAQVTESLTMLEQLAAKLDSSRALVGQLSEQARGAKEAEELSVQLTDLEEDQAKVAEATQAAAKEINTLNQKRIRGIAGELAKNLEPDTPCVVCGSLEHPSPATLAKEHPTEAELDEVFEESKRLQQQLEQLNQAHLELTAALTTATTLAKGLDVDAVTSKLAAARADSEAATQAEEAKIQLATDQKELQLRLAKLQHDHSDSRVELTELDGKLTTATAAVADLSESLETQRAEYSSVKARQDKLNQASAVLDLATQALNALRESKARSKRSSDLLISALRTSAVDDDEELGSLIAQESVIDDLQRTVDLHKSTSQHVEEQLAQKHIKFATEVPTTVIMLAKAEVATQRLKVEQRRDKLALAQSALERTEGQGVKVRKLLADYNKRVADVRPLLQLSKIVNASDKMNQRGIPLETYVLLHQFEHVVDAANVRLQQISQGRFTLQTSADRIGRDKKGGLNLEILDHNSEATRSPGDISGGETFYVALSLALGLADVVTSQSGGIELGTLLIDEGFGTLDPEVLDQVLRVVEGLSDSNRAVGIVSHVEELKERISDQIQVVRNEDHSSTLRIVG